jgi:class 3 adenylate cyclase
MEATHALVKLNNFTNQVNYYTSAPIKAFIPTHFSGHDETLPILLVFYIIGIYLCSFLLRKLKKNLQQAKLNYQHWRREMSKKVSKSHMSELDQKYEQLTSETTKPKDRKQLLREFVLLKKHLDTMGQDCAFLSIDVVNSTGMKAGEDKHISIHDFTMYNEIAIACLHEFGVIKYATTPDGIMSCFRTVDDAVNAALSLLDKLKIFNKDERQMKTEFQIRCGINSGFVYIEGLPLEQVTDHVIDIAGHMQKNAKPNCINIAGSAIEPLKTRGGFIETTDIIDDKRVYTWHGQ